MVLCKLNSFAQQNVSWKTMTNGEQEIHFLTYDSYINDFDRMKLKEWIADFKKENDIAFYYDGDTIININENDTMHTKLKIIMCTNRFPYSFRRTEGRLEKSYRESGRYFFNPNEVEIDEQFVVGNVSNAELIETYEKYYGNIDISSVSFKNGKFNGKIVCKDSSSYSGQRKLHLCVNEIFLDKIQQDNTPQKVIVLDVDKWLYYYTYLYNKGFRLSKGVFRKYVDAIVIPVTNSTQSTTE